MRFKTKSFSDYQNEIVAEAWDNARRFGKWHKRFVWFHKDIDGRLAVLETMWCRCNYFTSSYWGPVEQEHLREYRFLDEVPDDVDDPSRWEFPRYSTKTRFD